MIVIVHSIFSLSLSLSNTHTHTQDPYSDGEPKIKSEYAKLNEDMQEAFRKLEE